MTAVRLAVAFFLSLGLASANDLSHAVKAAFLPKFAPFVQWPAQAFASAASPIVICAQGEDPVAALAERAALGQGAWGRPIVVRRLAAVNAGSGCHIAYVAGSRVQAAGQALSALRGAPVLTVTDEGLSRGTRGMIDFVREGNRVRFDIDEAVAAANGIVISSKLLSLARAVNRR